MHSEKTFSGYTGFLKIISLVSGAESAFRQIARGLSIRHQTWLRLPAKVRLRIDTTNSSLKRPFVSDIGKVHVLLDLHSISMLYFRAFLSYHFGVLSTGKPAAMPPARNHDAVSCPEPNNADSIDAGPSCIQRPQGPTLTFLVLFSESTSFSYKKQTFQSNFAIIVECFQVEFSLLHVFPVPPCFVL